MHVLALGFNFQPKFPGLPIEDIIASVEALSRKLPSDTSAQLRVGLFKILSDLRSNPKQKKSLNKSNLSSKQWKAIFEPKKDSSIVIKPADKGKKNFGL